MLINFGFVLRCGALLDNPVVFQKGESEEEVFLTAMAIGAITTLSVNAGLLAHYSIDNDFIDGSGVCIILHSLSAPCRN